MKKNSALTQIKKALLFMVFFVVSLAAFSFVNSSKIMEVSAQGLTQTPSSLTPSNCTPIEYGEGEVIPPLEYQRLWWAECQCVTTCEVNGTAADCYNLCKTGDYVNQNNVCCSVTKFASTVNFRETTISMMSKDLCKSVPTSDTVAMEVYPALCTNSNNLVCCSATLDAVNGTVFSPMRSLIPASACTQIGGSITTGPTDRGDQACRDSGDGPSTICCAIPVIDKGNVASYNLSVLTPGACSIAGGTAGTVPTTVTSPAACPTINTSALPVCCATTFQNETSYRFTPGNLCQGNSSTGATANVVANSQCGPATTTVCCLTGSALDPSRSLKTPAECEAANGIAGTVTTSTLSDAVCPTPETPICCYDRNSGATSWTTRSRCVEKTTNVVKSGTITNTQEKCSALSGEKCCRYGSNQFTWTKGMTCIEEYRGMIDTSKKTEALCASTTKITCKTIGVNGCLNGKLCVLADVTNSRAASGSSCSTDIVTPPGQCVPLYTACGTERGSGYSDSCCGNGVCQGPSGQRICQDAGAPEDSFCTGGGTCSAYYGFKCDTLHTSPTSKGELVCEKNGQLFTEAQRAQALAYAGQCGQLDKVCVGGNNPGTLCGEFQIINQSCSNPTPPPVNPTPTPTPPPVIISCNSTCTTDAQCQAADSRFTCYTGSTGAKNCRLNSNPTSAICQPASGPMCLSIRMNNITRPTNTIQDPTLGDSVSLTCGTVSLAQRYIFRVVQPDGTISNLTATGPTSAAFTISQAGPYAAQCQICTGAADSTCLPYEPISYTPVN